MGNKDRKYNLNIANTAFLLLVILILAMMIEVWTTNFIFRRSAESTTSQLLNQIEAVLDKNGKEEEDIINLINEIPVSKGFEIYAVGMKSNKIIASSDLGLRGSSLEGSYAGKITFDDETCGKQVIKYAGITYYYNYRIVGDYVIAVVYSMSEGRDNLSVPILFMAVYLFIAGVVILRLFVKLNASNQEREKQVEDQREIENQHRMELEEQLNLVNTLSQDYLNVYVIDPYYQVAKILKLNGYITQGITQEQKEYPYEELCRNYIQNRVYGEDILMMTKVMDLDNIERELEHSDQYVGSYRIIDHNEIHYYQFKYAKIYGTDAIIAGFQNVDNMIAVEKEQQERLHQALMEAEHANTAKTLFLNNMSHDIRTPMNAILGFARLMKKKTDDPEIIMDYLDKIEKSGEYLLSIINNVLDMARIESGKMQLDLSPIDMGNEDKNISDLFARDVERKNLIMTNEKNITHQYVLGDGPRMKQIVVNLLSNAVKYTPEGGRIHFALKEIPCDKEGYATYISTVEDTGIGMREEFKDHIFELFSREHTTTENNVMGTGLGMSIVKGLVDMMGGSIEVESQIGKGTKFTVTFTLKILDNLEAPATGQKAPIDVRDFAGRRILLAEDNDLNAEITMEILSEFGFEVKRAADGVICMDMLAKAENGYYDLILMDIQMPNLNGYDTTRRIRALEDKDKAGIPILAMTANAFEEDRQRAMEAGMNGHLTKPIEMDKLMEMLDKVLKEANEIC